ncbi:hypothetical protein RCL_jg21849.t1 [Rhizophagus clarus]|uniref:Uncharacterized protein n=1 Tax=Rhizophagus clarus TaxID=94130 RepID=A0A8H3QGK7_9GLOM|nr:hypothetical protein RCL_jg21849.t1 [Rhizophagus clarus]
MPANWTDAITEYLIRYRRISVNGGMVREMEGGPGKEKDIIGSSAQGFGTDLGTTTVVGGVETLRIGGLRICCWTPGLGMLPAFLDEPDLGNVAGLLERTGLGNIAGLRI